MTSPLYFSVTWPTTISTLYIRTLSWLHQNSKICKFFYTNNTISNNKICQIDFIANQTLPFLSLAFTLRFSNWTDLRSNLRPLYRVQTSSNGIHSLLFLQSEERGDSGWLVGVGECPISNYVMVGHVILAREVDSYFEKMCRRRETTFLYDIASVRVSISFLSWKKE